jgi:hypothetical protein
LFGLDFFSLQSLELLMQFLTSIVRPRRKILKGKSPGAKPEMSDSEILTLALIMDYLPFLGETQFMGFIRANYGQWFPNLLERSQFNRRLRKLGGMLKMLRKAWVKQLGGLDKINLLIDTKPIPVVGYRRSKKYSDFHDSADYGYCAARKMKYFGYKLVALSTLKGLPIAYGLVPANTDKREAVEDVLEVVRGCDMYRDKGFIGQDWQEEITDSTGNRIWTIQRANQHQQASSSFRQNISII